MIGFFAKLPLKLASLPLRAARKAGRMLCNSSAGACAAEATPSSPEAFGSGRGSTPEPAPAPSPFDVQIDPSSVIQRVKEGEELVFLDVRQAAELSATGMIEGALHIPSQDLPRRMEELDKGAELFVYCAAGVRSLDAVMFLREKGFEQAWSLGGGLPHWEQDGGAVIGL